MFVSETTVRVRYSETDQMGYVYYGKYAEYFEVARVEALRDLGVSYKKMEEDGVMLPVLESNIKYIRPAYYDDYLTIKVLVQKMPNTRIIFDYEVYNTKNDLLTVASTVLVFVNAESKRPCKLPDYLEVLFNPFFHG